MDHDDTGYHDPTRASHEDIVQLQNQFNSIQQEVYNNKCDPLTFDQAMLLHTLLKTSGATGAHSFLKYLFLGIKMWQNAPGLSQDFRLAFITSQRPGFQNLQLSSHMLQVIHAEYNYYAQPGRQRTSHAGNRSE